MKTLKPRPALCPASLKVVRQGVTGAVASLTERGDLNDRPD